MSECDHLWYVIFCSCATGEVKLTEMQACTRCKSTKIVRSEAFLKELEESKKQNVEVTINMHHYKVAD